MPKIPTDHVFGIRAKPVLSYVERAEVDGAFAEALKSDHHIVIYGSSKQGKTALRQKHLDDKRDCCIVHPGPRTSIEGLYQPVLRDANVQITTFETKKEGEGTHGVVKTGFKALIPWIGGTDVAFEGGKKSEKQAELRTEFIAFDFGEAQSIGELLARVGWRKFIVIENFHYLPEETQKQLAFDLKTFHELGVRFIILGVWREANHLLQFNRDLEERFVEIPVEPWRDEDLRRVVATGAPQLNIEIAAPRVDQFVANAYGNVGMFQEFIKTYCWKCGVNETQDPKRALDDAGAVQETFAAKLRDQRNTFQQSLVRIAAKSRTDKKDPLVLPFYLVKVLLSVDLATLREGIDKRALLELLRGVHHREDKSTIRPGDITNLLLHLPDHQKDMQPPLLYFDSNASRLKIVDTRQFFVLANVDRQELAAEIPNPLADKDEE